ncbi:hypothetical protein LCGC14_0294990 [marine sediment metagenome]|uniref:Uncharacterized protein n=1 Tax=marine sediment metagenome TaxID=412755 RepID=A0A0F9WDE5_9ZZZZ
MPQVGSSSFLSNMATRRAQLNKTRAALLDQPGIQRTGGPPPPVVPAQRPNPQQQAIEPVSGGEQETPESNGPELNTREARLDAVGQRLDAVRAMKIAQAKTERRLVPSTETKEGRLFQLKGFLHLLIPAAKVRHP